MLENLGAKLKSARNNAGLSRQQVADLVFPAVSSVFMKPANACHR